jgi:hypothetical protein
MLRLIKQTEKDQDALEAVLAAIEAGNCADLTEALPAAQTTVSSGVPIRGSGVLPLQAAIKLGNAEMVVMLLDAGAPLDAADGQGMTPLQVHDRCLHAACCFMLNAMLLTLRKLRANHCFRCVTFKWMQVRMFEPAKSLQLAVQAARKAEECDIEGLLLQRGAQDEGDAAWGASADQFDPDRSTGTSKADVQVTEQSPKSPSGLPGNGAASTGSNSMPHQAHVNGKRTSGGKRKAAGNAADVSRVSEDAAARAAAALAAVSKSTSVRSSTPETEAAQPVQAPSDSAAAPSQAAQESGDASGSQADVQAAQHAAASSERIASAAAADAPASSGFAAVAGGGEESASLLGGCATASGAHAARAMASAAVKSHEAPVDPAEQGNAPQESSAAEHGEEPPFTAAAASATPVDPDLAVPADSREELKQAGEESSHLADTSEVRQPPDSVQASQAVASPTAIGPADTDEAQAPAKDAESAEPPVNEKSPQQSRSNESACQANSKEVTESADAAEASDAADHGEAPLSRGVSESPDHAVNDESPKPAAVPDVHGTPASSVPASPADGVGASQASPSTGTGGAVPQHEAAAPATPDVDEEVPAAREGAPDAPDDSPSDAAKARPYAAHGMPPLVYAGQRDSCVASMRVLAHAFSSQHTSDW